MEREELLQLYKKEKDPNVKDRLMPNIMVRFENHSITEAAHSLGKVTSWGSKWYRRFAKAGLEGLQNLPRPGRPTRITGEETRNTERYGWETVLDRRSGARADIQGDWRHVQRLVRLQDAKALGVLPQGAGKAARAQAARRGDRQVPEGARRGSGRF